MLKDNLNKAILFGQSLDNDDFKTTAGLLSSECIYFIGATTLVGPSEITGSYEQNMIEGRAKLDELEWGKSCVEQINGTEFFVHFTDYLKHKEISHTHRCKQKLFFGENGYIIKIEHIHNEEEQKKLDDFYRKVGLK